MMFTDEEAAELKRWVVKKLDDISDADSDVLADYVLALIRADNPEAELKANATENLEDFLKDNTARFVDEIFMAIDTKSYIPGYVPPTTSSLPTPPFAPPTGPSALYDQIRPRGEFNDGIQQSRKRSYNDRHENGNGVDPHYGRNDRQIKQLRRGGGRGDVSRNGRAGLHLQSHLPGLHSPSSVGFPAVPPPAPGLPFDSNDPMAMMMSMQAMGFPLPGFPPIPQAGSPTGFQQSGEQGSLGSNGPMKQKINARCRDYDTKGFCTRGNACPFEHGNDLIVMPGQQDEYDPKNSVMMDIQTNPTTTTNGHISLSPSRGGSFPRGRGHSRGDRGGFPPHRRNIRADFSHVGPNNDRSITSIVIEQIPEEKFDEQTVRDFFSQFGTIDSVTMQAYKRLAIVKYNDYHSAKSAYESPKVIFDNRFVKVYWYKPDSVPTPTTNGANGGAKAGSPVTATTAKTEEIPFDKERFERDAMAAQKKLEEKKAMIRDAETKRKELERQKEDLAKKQAEEKRKLMEKLKAKGQSAGAAGPVPDLNQKDEKAKALTEGLKKQLALLEAEAMSLGIDPSAPPPEDDSWSARGRGRGRGRGGYRGWEGFAGRGRGLEYVRGGYRGGRGSYRGGTAGGGNSLDNRTKKVRVSGTDLEGEKDEALRQYLLGIGEFDTIEPERKDSLVIVFKERYVAENFFYGTKDIPGVGKVELGWVNSPLPPIALHSKDGAVGTASALLRPGETDADGDMGMEGASSTGDNNNGAPSLSAGRRLDPPLQQRGTGGGGGGEIDDYDVAEEDDRWMI